MSYSQVERGFFLELAAAAALPQHRGFAEVTIEGPNATFEDAAVKQFASDGLLEIVAHYISPPRVRVKFTSQGYRLAETMQAGL